MEPKEKVRQALDIVDVISDVVTLKPEGSNRLKGLCPFHDERTPSFFVMPDKGFYYCFGCQRKGDLYQFVMESQNLDFPDALKLLGARAGIEIPSYEPDERTQKNKSLYYINDLALEYYRESLLTSNEAKEYLKTRHLTQITIDKYEIGYAPQGWDTFIKYAKTKGVSDRDLIEASLAIEADNGRRYDRFRNRVMFPIKNHLGRVVGFTGRVLDEKLPKYLNTGETSIFDKSSILYGLDIARKSIKESKECILVEGQMDAITLNQEGFDNVVAVQGSSLTNEQTYQLSRLEAEVLYLAFDSDEAGQRAILSGLDQSIGREFLVRAVKLPSGKDPADMVLNLGAKAFQEALHESMSEVEFRFGLATKKHDTSTNSGKKDLLTELLPVLKPRSLFDPVSAEMKRLVIDYLDLDSERLDAWLKKQRSNLSKHEIDGMVKRRAKVSNFEMVEIEIMALLLSDPNLLAERLVEFETRLPYDKESRTTLNEFFDVCKLASSNEQKILGHYKDHKSGALLFEMLLGYMQGNGDTFATAQTNRMLEKLFSRLRELHLDSTLTNKNPKGRNHIEELSSKITDPNTDKEELSSCLSELKDLHFKLQARDAERRNRADY